jgi:hypothetical protein
MRSKSSDERMRQEGYMPAAEAAKYAGRDTSAIYRWIASGEVQGKNDLSQRYVLVSSLVLKLGVDRSVQCGLISKERAALFEKQSKKGQV